MRRRRLLKAAMKANSEALRLGVYFSWSIAVITAVLMLGETVLLALMTRDTVAVETPASFAMSFTVAWLMPCSRETGTPRTVTLPTLMPTPAKVKEVLRPSLPPVSGCLARPQPSSH
jgi:hypothetical protein